MQKKLDGIIKDLTEGIEKVWLAYRLQKRFIDYINTYYINYSIPRKELQGVLKYE